MFLSDASLKRPIAVTSFIILIVAAGAVSYFRTRLTFLPDIDMPTITVVTVYPGAGPEEVESQVSTKIEDAVSELAGIKTLQSVSMENASQVIIEFEIGTDIDLSAMEVKDNVELILNQLPSDCEKPKILKFDPNAKAIMNLAVYGDRSTGEAYDISDRIIRDQLANVPGVASVELIGGNRREIRVLVDESRLVAHSIALTSVAQALGTANIDIPSGRVTETSAEYSIKTDGKFVTVDDIRRIEVPSPFGKTVKLTDIADIRDDYDETRHIAIFNEKECVSLSVKKRSDANTVDVVRGVMRKLDDIRARIPAGLEISVINEDAGFIQDSVDDVMVTIGIGILLTGFLLMLFLHNARQVVIASVAMPVSIISTFTLIYFVGYTLNVLTLMALGLGVGILVTNAIVVLENIERHLAMPEHSSTIDAVMKGTAEIAIAVIGSTLTNIVVFVPVVFMSSIAGQLFAPFGLTMVFATLVSMFISFTLTPILAALLLDKSTATLDANGHPVAKKGFAGAWERGMDGLAGAYRSSVRWTMNHRLIILASGMALLIASAGLVPYLGSEFFENPDQGMVLLTLEMDPGTPIEKTKGTLLDAERRIMSGQCKDVIDNSFIHVGKIEGIAGKSTEGVHVGNMLLKLKDKSVRSMRHTEVAEIIRSELATIPALSIVVQIPSVMGGSSLPLQLDLYGPDLQVLSSVAATAQTIARNVDGTADIDSSLRPGKPELRIIPDRERLDEYGLTVAALGMLVRANIAGLVPSQFKVGDDEYDIRIQLKDADRQTADQVRQFLIPTPAAGFVTLDALATVKLTEGPTQILRKGKQRFIAITGDAVGRSIGDIVNDINGGLKAATLPEGYSYEFSGMVKNMNESFRDLGMAFIMAVVLTYLALAALLESWLQPFTILFTLPLAFIGVFPALFLTGNPVSAFGLMSVVMLVGIVVNNAILIIDYVVVLRRAGAERLDALLAACFAKLRPILMTSLATIIAMLPIAMGFGWGAEIRAPMAIVTIGGLVASTALSLFIIPIAYTVSDDIILRIRGKQ